MKHNQQSRILSSFLQGALAILLLLSSTLTISAGNPFLSVQVARDVTGSGLGGNVRPSLAFTHNKSTLAIGPNFQRRKMNMSGLQASYRHVVAGSYNKKLELYFFGNMTFHSSAYLSRQNIEIQKSSHTEDVPAMDCESLRLRVFEGYAGAGLKFNPAKRLSGCLSIGIGGFNTFNKDYHPEMFRAKADLSLQYQFMLIYSFQKLY